MKLLYAALLLISSTCLADSVELREVDLVYRRYKDGSRNLMVPNHRLGEGVNLNVNVDLLGCLYFNNTIHSYVDRADNAPGQFRAVGWEYRIGIDLSKTILFTPLQIGFYHYSQHSLDENLGFNYPQESALEVRFTIYRR